MEPPISIAKVLAVTLITPYTQLSREELQLTTSTDPEVNAAVTTELIGNYRGVVIKLNGAGNPQTLQDPADTTAGQEYIVICDDANGVYTIDVNGITMSAGEAQSFVWDGSAWAATTVLDAGISDEVYGNDWDGVESVAPSKNAVYDELETKLDKNANIDGGGF